MKQSLKMALIALPLTFSLTGCIIVSTDEGTHTGWINSSDWKKEQSINNKKIADLTIGQSFESVRDDMGTPEFNEAFEQSGTSYQVLFYRTDHRRSDGMTTKDECTPLVFENGKLTGWGEKAYRAL